jgi:hypothetical protein
VNSEKKQIVYYCNGIADEPIRDYAGEEAIPNQNAIISYKDKKWKVVQINWQRALGPNEPLPVVHIYLTDSY